MELLKKIDRGWARVEGWLIVAVLLMMVLTAGWQALIRNLTRFDIQWANEMLTDLEWADSFLRKGTLWLAFLGASIATHVGKHIGIDVLTRIAPVRAKYTMLALAGVMGGLITLGLTYSFWDAVKLNLTERPIEYEMLGEEGSMHVCDASDAQLAALDGFERPGTFCVLRGSLSAIGIPAETPGAAFQLIVPLMFLVIGLRLLGQGIGSAMVLAGGPAALAQAESEERAKIEAQSESVKKALAGAEEGGQS